jgi:hypothetical protein
VGCVCERARVMVLWCRAHQSCCNVCPCVLSVTGGGARAVPAAA